MPSQITDWSAAFMSSWATALALLLSGLPKILGFVLILTIGWVIAAVLAKAVAAVLRSIQFNALAERSGFAGFVNKLDVNVDSAGIIGAVVKWFVRLVALVGAFDVLGLPVVSDVVRQLLLWLPNLVVALVVLVIAGLAANALSNFVRVSVTEAGVKNPAMLAKVTSGLVWAFGVIVAVYQLGIATNLVTTLFTAVMAGLALALGLAFGLGGRETAAQVVRNWYHSGRGTVSVYTPQTEADYSPGRSSVDVSLHDRRMMARRTG